MAEQSDIYPLGQGQGLLSDVINFALNNLYQAGQTAASKNKRVSDIFSALQSGKAADLSPLMEEASNVNPISGVLGPIGKVTSEALGSPGAAKAVNQAQKKVVKALFRGDPTTLKEVVESPRMMHVGIPGAGANLSPENQRQLIDEVMQGAFAHFQPHGVKSGTVRVDPAVMRGFDRQGQLLKDRRVEGLPDMVVHEATHFLNEPGFLKTQQSSLSTDVGRVARAIQEFIGHTRYGDYIINEHLKKGRPDIALNEALSYLSEPTGRGPAATWLHNALTDRPNEFGIGQFGPNTRGLLQEALDAALRVPGSRRIGGK